LHKLKKVSNMNEMQTQQSSEISRGLKKLSRRDFLKLVATGAASAGLLTACERGGQNYEAYELQSGDLVSLRFNGKKQPVEVHFPREVGFQNPIIIKKPGLQLAFEPQITAFNPGNKTERYLGELENDDLVEVQLNLGLNEGVEVGYYSVPTTNRGTQWPFRLGNVSSLVGGLYGLPVICSGEDLMGDEQRPVETNGNFRADGDTGLEPSKFGLGYLIGKVTDGKDGKIFDVCGYVPDGRALSSR
jgi:hypothetical protein